MWYSMYMKKFNPLKRFDENQMNSALQELIGNHNGTFSLESNQQDLTVAINHGSVAINHLKHTHGKNAHAKQIEITGTLNPAARTFTDYVGLETDRTEDGQLNEARTLTAAGVLKRLVEIDFQLFNGPEAGLVTFTPNTQVA
jgi:hypothetical protein